MKRSFLLPVILSCLPVFAAPDPPLIMIDPGHGGSAVAGSLDKRSNSSPNNAASPDGLLEKNLTLELSLLVKQEIIAEANRHGRSLGVWLTREDDRNLDFIERAKMCNQPNTACVVSIHFNAGNGAASGTLAVVAAKEKNPNHAVDDAFARGLVTACHEAVREFVPDSKDRGTISDSHLHGGLGSNFFFQLQRQPHLKSIPKCFLEVEFIDNPAVEKQLLGDDRAAKFQKIAAAIAKYLIDATEAPALPKP